MYKAYITRIKDIKKHSNADRLLIGTCFENNVIVSTDYVDNQLGIYFPVDGKLGIEFAEENNLLRKKDENGNEVGGYLDPDKRNIRALRLRGEKSDGLFLPIESLSKFCDVTKLHDGDVIDKIGNIVICEKYIPINKKGFVGQPKCKVNNVDFPFFEEHVDTEQLSYNQSAFKFGDICTMTLKMHGTSDRISRNIKTYIKKRLFRKPIAIKKWECVSGSRRTVIDFNNNQSGYYGDNEFRKHWHDLVTPKLEKGETVYGEIVGWIGDRPIMSQCQNKKVDKEFVKYYGDITTFSYGCSVGENDFYVYRMTMTNEDGIVVEYPTWYAKLRAEQIGLKFVPIFETFIFQSWEDLMRRVENYYDGADPIGKNHIREGVVVRIENRGKFKAFKHKNFSFKMLEGIIKDSATEPDMEEAESV